MSAGRKPAARKRSPPKTMSLPRVIAMDGPSASGKGTLARRLAKELGFTYVDSGAMYRTLAWHCLASRVALPASSPDLNAITERPIVEALRRWKAELGLVDGALWLHVNGYFPRQEIRTDPVEHLVPIVAQISQVRRWMVDRQRQCTQFGPLVMEGRDIGTEVFPLAPVKFFLDADPAARAARMLDRGNAAAGDQRDQMDRTRRQGALVKALDAVRVDNTGQTVDETFSVLMDHVRQRAGALGLAPMA